jgi:hypothetical protein
MDTWLVVVIVIVAVGGIGYLFYVRRFTCECGRKLKLLDVDRCPACQRYYKRDGKSVRMLGPGAVEEKAVFVIPDTELPFDPAAWRWPNQCAVCGGPAERYDQVTRGRTTSTYAGGAMREVLKLTFGVPHCLKHSRGVEDGMADSLNIEGRPGGALRFRSYDYWMSFRTMNCRASAGRPLPQSE